MRIKKQTENQFSEIIRNYGSLEAYNEEQRRCGLVTIETAMQANPFTQMVSFDHATPLKVVEDKEVKTSEVRGIKRFNKLALSLFLAR